MKTSVIPNILLACWKTVGDRVDLSSKSFPTVFPSQLTKINLNRYFILVHQQIWCADVHGNVQLHFFIHQLQSTKESKFPFLLFFSLHSLESRGQTGSSFLVFFTRSMKVARFFSLRFQPFLSLFNPSSSMCASRERETERGTDLKICNCTLEPRGCVAIHLRFGAFWNCIPSRDHHFIELKTRLAFQWRIISRKFFTY